MKNDITIIIITHWPLKTLNGNYNDKDKNTNHVFKIFRGKQNQITFIIGTST